jgi:4-diphosphocytidyl-2C-methyl-D-erythritol kinase
VPTGSVTVRVPGKVNLYLGVGDLREDGYHELTTVFHAVSLFDEITVRNADVLSLELTGEDAGPDGPLPTDHRNLAWRAAELLAEHVGRAPDVAISIEKSIPVAGGMAGGSADAAGVLVAINALWELGVPRRDLHALAAELGSDVPFALHGGTALGTGRGEQLATVLARNTFHWVLAFANGGLSTPKVFGELDRLRARVDEADRDLPCSRHWPPASPANSRRCSATTCRPPRSAWTPDCDARCAQVSTRGRWPVWCRARGRRAPSCAVRQALRSTWECSWQATACAGPCGRPAARCTGPEWCPLPRGRGECHAVNAVR